MTDHTPLTDTQLDLDEIEARAAHLYEYIDQPEEADLVTGTDVPALVAEVRRLQKQRRLLLDQLRRKDARTGEGDRALAAFVAGEKPDTEPEPKPSRVQCNDCGAVGSVFTGDDDRQYLDPSGQIGHQAGT